DGQLRFWRTGAAQQNVVTIKAGGPHLAWEPAGARLAYLGADRSLRVYDATRHQDGQAAPGPLRSDVPVVWTIDGRCVATLDADGKITFWDPAQGKAAPAGGRVTAGSNGKQTLARDWYCSVVVDYQPRPLNGLTKLQVRAFGEDLPRATMALGY